MQVAKTFHYNKKPAMIKDIKNKNDEVQTGDKELNALKHYFPQCFKDGNFDIEAFKSALPGGLSITDETLGFNFLGKSYARLLANMDTTTLIKPDRKHNALPENKDSQNVYISGDNLDALQHLLKSYTGRVKVIYIDPPYNTGSDGFVYNDKFTFTPEQISERIGVNQEQAERILSMTRRGSASHAAWLTFMLPRLSLARDLLTNDGVIFISIDDNEQANLRLLCDEIFGEECFIAQFCKKGSGGRQGSTYFANIHEYVVCYAMSDYLSGEDEKESDSYPYTDSQGRKYKISLLRKWGDEALRSDRPNMYYPLYFNGEHCSLKKDVTTIAEIYPMLDIDTEGRWRWGKDTMQDAIDKNLIEIRKNKTGNYIAYEKIFEPSEDDVQTKLYNTWIDDINNQTGKKLLKDLFGGMSPFEYPKPLDLIKKVLKMGNCVDGIVLDFFSGSGTTAHAVMEMNAEDGDHRRFILVQWPEKVKENSPAQQMGFKTIDEIGQKRIKLAAEKISQDYPNTKADLGFRHYTLIEPERKVLDEMESFNPQAMFSTDNTLETLGVDTVLRTWLEADGYGLTADPEEVKLGKYTAYYIGEHLYLINKDDTFDVDAMVDLMDKYNGEVFSPQNVVLYGYSFGVNNRIMLKTNLRTLKDGNKSLKVNIDVRY